MSTTIIPANPGFFIIRLQPNGERKHLPIIAWSIDGDLVLAMTVDGLVPDGEVIYGPDGTQAHE